MQMRAFFVSICFMLSTLVSIPSYALDRSDVPAVRHLAAQLESTAERLKQHAGNRAGIPANGIDDRLSRRLHRFEESADRLHDKVRSNELYRLELDSVLDQLNRDASRVDAVIYQSGVVPPAVRDWEHAKRLLIEINRYVYADDRFGPYDRRYGPYSYRR
jgi:hypothetical protein